MPGPYRPPRSGQPTDPRWARPYSGTVGGAVQPLPIVVTVGVNAITDTSVNVIGSVNPNGLETSWWIAYGTSLPLSGPVTPATDIGSGTVPLSVTKTLTGLSTGYGPGAYGVGDYGENTSGTTYYVAVVGQSSAGTVYGQVLSFVAQSPVVPKTQRDPRWQPFVTIPHFAAPFSLVTSGAESGAIVVDQDTLDEIAANVTTVVMCQVGQCPQLPNFGRPGLTFAQEPVDTRGLVDAIERQEPRANEDVLGQLDLDGTTWDLTLLTSTAGTEGV